MQAVCQKKFPVTDVAGNGGGVKTACPVKVLSNGPPVAVKSTWSPSGSVACTSIEIVSPASTHVSAIGSISGGRLLQVSMSICMSRLILLIIDPSRHEMMLNAMLYSPAANGESQVRSPVTELIPSVLLAEGIKYPGIGSPP